MIGKKRTWRDALLQVERLRSMPWTVVVCCCCVLALLVFPLWLLSVPGPTGSLGVRSCHIRTDWRGGVRVGGWEEGCAACGVSSTVSEEVGAFSVSSGAPLVGARQQLVLFAHMVKSGGTTASRVLRGALEASDVCPGSRDSEQIAFSPALLRSDWRVAEVGEAGRPPVLETRHGERVELLEGDVKSDSVFRAALGREGALISPAVRRNKFRDPLAVDPTVWKGCKVLLGHFGPALSKRVPVENAVFTTIRRPDRFRESVWRHEEMFGREKKRAGGDPWCFFESFAPDEQIRFVLGQSQLWGGTALRAAPRADVDALQPRERLDAAVAALAAMPWFGIVDDDHWPASVCLLYYVLGADASAHPYTPTHSTVIRHAQPSPFPANTRLAAASNAAAHEWCWYKQATDILRKRLQALRDILRNQPTQPKWLLKETCQQAFEIENVQ